MVILHGKRESMNLRATSVARLYFRQEFGRDVCESIRALTADSVAYDRAAAETAKLAWAMNKADNFAAGVSTPDFPQWLETHRDFEFMDNIVPIVREIAKGFMVKAGESDDSSGEDADADDIAYWISAVAVRLGIGLMTLNEYTTQAFMDTLRIYVKSGEESQESNVRVATPEDVDRFWR